MISPTLSIFARVADIITASGGLADRRALDAQIKNYKAQLADLSRETAELQAEIAVKREALNKLNSERDKFRDRTAELQNALKELDDQRELVGLLQGFVSSKGIDTKAVVVSSRTDVPLT